eukprot:scaffold37412_cov30-Tisochrysis_lutea.AAC.2
MSLVRRRTPSSHASESAVATVPPPPLLPELLAGTVATAKSQVLVKAGEKIVVWARDGRSEVRAGYSVVQLRPGDSFDFLTNCVAGATEYLEITRPNGEQELLRGPTNRWVLRNGMDPFTADTVLVKPAFMLSTSEVLVSYTSNGQDGSLVRELITGGQGGQMFVPELGQHVHTFSWSNPETGEAEGWTFSILNFRAAQSLKLLVNEVLLDDKRYDVILLMPYKWKNGLAGIEKLLQYGGDDPIPLLQRAARADLMIQGGHDGSWSQLKEFVETIGMELAMDASGDEAQPAEADGNDTSATAATGEEERKIIDNAAKVTVFLWKELVAPLTHAERLELIALENKLNVEVELQAEIAAQEIQLSHMGAWSAQWLAHMKQATQIEAESMAEIAAIAKGAAGADKSYSRVAACCCCSVAVKTSGGIWAQLHGEGSGKGVGVGKSGQSYDTQVSGGTSGSYQYDFNSRFGGGKLGTSTKVNGDTAVSSESQVKPLAEAVAHTSVGEPVSKA